MKVLDTVSFLVNKRPCILQVSSWDPDTSEELGTSHPFVKEIRAGA